MTEREGTSGSRERSGQTRFATAEGLINIPSQYSVDEIVQRLKAILRANGVTLFVVVDHSEEARKVGIEMRPTKLLLFGNPKAGTPLMLAVPSIAIDLPLKILVWENAEGMVWVTYNSSDYLQRRYRLSADLTKAVDVVGTLAAKATE
jgi:uncharacterized protein (DUF302 family)